MQGQFYAPPLTKITKYILIAAGGLFLLDSIAGLSGVGGFLPYLGLSLHGVLSGKIHTLITYPFVNKGLFSVIFDGLILWFIGSELEARWGQKTYLQFFLSSVLGAGIVFLLVGLIFFKSPEMMVTPFVGLTGFCYALLFAYGLIFSERQMVFMLLFPMKARYFCMILAAIELYMGIFSPFGKTAWGHLAAMAVGFGFLRFKTMWLAREKKHTQQKKKSRKGKANLYLVSDEESPQRPSSDDPKYWQ